MISKNRNYPKNAKNAWMFFQTERREEIKAQGLVGVQATTRLAEMWRTLSEEEKKPYQILADQDKKRFEAQARGGAEKVE